MTAANIHTDADGKGGAEVTGALVRPLPEKWVWATGSHVPDSTGCIMEAVAYVTGEPWSDRPKCADPGITAAAIYTWDRCDEASREKMKELLSLIAGTSSIPPEKLRFFWADKAIRVIAPMALDAAGLKGKATKLRNLPRIDSASAARSAESAARSAASAASAAVWAESAASAAVWAESAASASARSAAESARSARSAASAAESAASAAESARSAAWSVVSAWSTMVDIIREACEMKEVKP